MAMRFVTTVCLFTCLLHTSALAQETFNFFDRFEVKAEFQTPTMTEPQAAHGGLIDDSLGYFHFFSASNVELLVRVIDACQVNGHYWVFAAGMTNVEVTLTVTDLENGQATSYFSPLGTKPMAPILDTRAFETCPSPRPGKQTVAAATGEKMLSLLGNRFQVSLDWAFNGDSGTGDAQFLTSSSGGFAIFDDLDTFVKVIDGRAINGSFWVYVTGFSPAAQTITVTDTETNVSETYTVGENEPLAIMDTSFATKETQRWIFPWLSNNATFASRLIVNNFGSQSAQVALTARRGDGSTATVERTIQAGGFLREDADSLFPSLGAGAGYAVTMTAETTQLAGRWVTFNLGTASGGSPSQGVAVKFEGGEDSSQARNRRVGAALMYGYLPGDAVTLAAPVIVNVGDAPTDATLYFFADNGTLLGTETLTDLVPLQPFAAITSDLLADVDGDVSMVAVSEGEQPLTGVVFTFNDILEPSIGNAEAVDFVPPGAVP